MAAKGAKNKRMTSEEKKRKKLERQVVYNQPYTMFYHTERCILKEDAYIQEDQPSSSDVPEHRQRASEYEYSSVKLDSQKMNSLLMDAR
jgi:hypothetical protein